VTSYRRRARADRERLLVDDLLARVQLRHDEVHRRPVRQHVAGEGVAVRLRPREPRQQAVVQVDDPPAGEPPADGRGQDPHVAGHDEVIGLRLVEDLHQAVVVRHPLVVADQVPIDPELLGQAAARWPVAEEGDRRRPLA
jgi:hypothetical protein